MGFTDGYELKSGAKRWRAYYRNPEGAQKSKSGFKTKRDAEAFIAKTEVSKLDHAYIDPTKAKTSVGELGKRWAKVKESQMKPSGWRSYESAWRIHVEPRWGNTPLSRIERLDIEEWIADLGEDLGADSIGRCHGVLHGILKMAVENGMLVRNPAAGVPLPTPDEVDPVFLTHSQLEAFITEAGRGSRTRSDAPAIVSVLGYCGLRWGELAALTPERIDGNRIHVVKNVTQGKEGMTVGSTKGGKRRVVPIPRRVQAVLAALVNYTKAGSLVFPAEDGGYAKSPGADTWFSRAVARCQEVDPTFPDLTPHKLRHTAVSLAISTGASIKSIQAIAGHKDAGMTLNKYGHLMSAELDHVADALDVAASTVTGVDWTTWTPEKCSENEASVINLDNIRKA
ncbi:site-specific integrase [Mycobacteroides abscessus]|uniref:Phage-related integrase n=1 Tax=Mycobacteroides abscessus subsp. abscessus TaxID=1185650 RepID=A0AB38CZ61_9MYCO|nr:site-specific integrase [Mycobacteroides abscessus]SHO87281.1 phage-related integrase [Mycobacteroides abscessus subsp. abscessus]SHP06640.1 phage-related integrase [Mycobacteroides abscessus subsp. abscessus]SHP19698.1 phage-related integrase [Mycobacteroides abscessus subsp. abscessus]SHP38068.1 phage-related integrase [Mycobacteroides abscessus subsp. abscessus]SHP45888.1 phage-related integrase [Mycobacteroides abscessus subsp. abscessus]